MGVLERGMACQGVCTGLENLVGSQPLDRWSMPTCPVCTTTRHKWASRIHPILGSSVNPVMEHSLALVLATEWVLHLIISTWDHTLEDHMVATSHHLAKCSMRRVPWHPQSHMEQVALV